MFIIFVACYQNSHEIRKFKFSKNRELGLSVANTMTKLDEAHLPKSLIKRFCDKVSSN